MVRVETLSIVVSAYIFLVSLPFFRTAVLGRYMSRKTFWGFPWLVSSLMAHGSLVEAAYVLVDISFNQVGFSRHLRRVILSTNLSACIYAMCI